MSEPLLFRSPANDRHHIQVPQGVSDLKKKFNGTITSPAGDEYDIKNNVIDLLGSHTINKTLAQATNFWTLTAELYETGWRNHSISLLSGVEYSIADEQELLTNWMPPKAGSRYLDIGCSTALYARTLGRAEPNASVVALDFSLSMLQAARKKSMDEGVNVYLVCANAENLPFFSGTFHGLVCGGSLNEFSNPARALIEARRVIRPDGLFFIMYLLKSESFLGRTLQLAAAGSGLQFRTKNETMALFEQCGFRIRKEKEIGIVHFCLLEPS